ncbi:hypothetical protein V5O48_005167, partial [Marasmius crinis-equi]
MSFSNSQGATFNSGQFDYIAGDGMSSFSNSDGSTFYDWQYNDIAGNQYNNTNHAGTQYNNNSAGN